MQSFPGGNPDPQQLQATMLAIEQACSLIQICSRSWLLANKFNSVCSPAPVRGSVLRSSGAAVLDLVQRAAFRLGLTVLSCHFTFGWCVASVGYILLHSAFPNIARGNDLLQVSSTVDWWLGVDVVQMRFSQGLGH
jgi:hypothetical protein